MELIIPLYTIYSLFGTHKFTLLAKILAFQKFCFTYLKLALDVGDIYTCNLSEFVRIKAWKYKKIFTQNRYLCSYKWEILPDDFTQPKNPKLLIKTWCKCCLVVLNPLYINNPAGCIYTIPTADMLPCFRNKSSAQSSLDGKILINLTAEQSEAHHQAQRNTSLTSNMLCS